MDGGNEVASGGEHDEVDGVEVLFAAEAPAEIGLGMDGGERLAATWTDETETTVPVFAGPVEVLGDQLL